MFPCWPAKRLRSSERKTLSGYWVLSRNPGMSRTQSLQPMFSLLTEKLPGKNWRGGYQFNWTAFGNFYFLETEGVVVAEDQPASAGAVTCEASAG